MNKRIGCSEKLENIVSKQQKNERFKNIKGRLHFIDRSYLTNAFC